MDLILFHTMVCVMWSTATYSTPGYHIGGTTHGFHIAGTTFMKPDLL